MATRRNPVLVGARNVLVAWVAIESVLLIVPVLRTAASGQGLPDQAALVAEFVDMAILGVGLGLLAGIPVFALSYWWQDRENRKATSHAADATRCPHCDAYLTHCPSCGGALDEPRRAAP